MMPQHGEIMEHGDEFNKDDMCWCAICCMVHTHAYEKCNGLRRPTLVEPISAAQARPEGSALDVQVAGSHYKKMKIQPVEFITANDLGFLEGCIIKRVCRWEDKDGIQDLQKAKHEIDLLIELKGKK